MYLKLTYKIVDAYMKAAGKVTQNGNYEVNTCVMYA